VKNLFPESGERKERGKEKKVHQNSACKNIPVAGLILSGSSGLSGGKPLKTFVSPTRSCRPKQHNAAYRASHPGGSGKWKGHPITVEITRRVIPVGGGGGMLAAHPSTTEGIKSLLLFTVCFIFLSSQ
jgi:hypothetical protein